MGSSDRTFQLDGVSDGEYEITAIGGNYATNELLSSAPRRITVRGADVTGRDLPLAPMSSIDGHVNLEADPKLNCGRRRDSALRETMVTLQRAPLAEKSAASKEKTSGTTDAPLSQVLPQEAVPNEKGDLSFRNLFAATYRFEVHLPAAGWYVRSVSLARSELNIARSGVSLKQGEKVSGLTIAVAEGGASLRGRVTVPEGQNVPANLRIYVVPGERENSDNLLRFFEAAVENDGAFVVGNIAPGKDWLVVDTNTLKSTRTDSDLRAKILHDAAALNKEIAFKPCERNLDYEFRYPSR